MGQRYWDGVEPLREEYISLESYQELANIAAIGWASFIKMTQGFGGLTDRDDRIGLYDQHEFPQWLRDQVELRLGL